ncbi:hypothetical protein KTJ32_03645 [Acinetobacter gyllenbergii]|uniref:hypothetical protein n=1 Tax=Acinetobacter gyllenbergii TaxID=134534 RepID=UPI0021D39389|nr:hypothetical protein [Acinetobacter gyllenbergii]MCU4580096.1 hypothetical protein [Acinetobacter gyllenbergii]
MFKFLKKIFGSSEQYINTVEVLKKPAVEGFEEQDCDVNVAKTSNANSKQNHLDELLWQLRSYDGYTRQQTLETLQDCYEVELFPALLFRLSDYVPINQQLAAAHFRRWSKRSEFSQLCIDYFLDIAAIQQRMRVVPEIETLLLQEVANNTAYLQETLISVQGKLPRMLLLYINKYKWIERDCLIELCKAAKDQMVRKFWLDHFIQHQSNQDIRVELKAARLRDVQYHLFDVLYQRKFLTTDDLIYLWHSPFLAVMDYAYFALRQHQFDFEKYFSQHSIDSLDQQQLKKRVYQWVLYKGESSHLFEIVGKIESKQIANALVLFALKQKQINLLQFLEYIQLTKQILLPYQFIKAKIYSDTQPTLDELKQYLCLVKENLSLQQRLDLTQGYSLWDQLYWFVTQQKYIQTENDQQNFSYNLRWRLQFLSYEIYPPRWTIPQKNEMKQHLPAFTQKYPEIFEDVGVKKILENI